MKTTLHVISILACLSFAALGAKAQEINEEGVPSKYHVNTEHNPGKAVYLSRQDSINALLNIRGCRGETTEYIIDGKKITTGKATRVGGGCYPVYYIDGKKIDSNKADSTKVKQATVFGLADDTHFIPAKDENACHIPVKDVNSIEAVSPWDPNHPFNTTDRTYYTRWEFKEFGYHNFPGIWH